MKTNDKVIVTYENISVEGYVSKNIGEHDMRGTDPSYFQIHVSNEENITFLKDIFNSTSTDPYIKLVSCVENSHKSKAYTNPGDYAGSWIFLVCYLDKASKYIEVRHNIDELADKLIEKLSKK